MHFASASVKSTGTWQQIQEISETLWQIAAAKRSRVHRGNYIAAEISVVVDFQSPLEEGANVGRGKWVFRGRDGLKRFRMPQTAQYPRAIPKTKQTMIVKSSKNDIKTGVMSFLFYGL